MSETRRVIVPLRSRLLVLACLVGIVTACGSSDEAQPLTTTPSGSYFDPGVSHIHGLGVDPRDGVLYAATHHGVFRVPAEGGAERIAQRYQDTMGFTVAGDGAFLGSGHPDFDKDPQWPPLLGLIRSVDRAQTWQSISLLGTVDFHVLRLAHGKIYGWDATSGRLMTSGDGGRTWETLITLSLRDFVVSPADPTLILATTPAGLQRSRDGGRSFGVVGAPPVLVLGWDATGGLYGVEQSGRVQASDDAGGTWRDVGDVGGEPEALLVTSTAIYAAVEGRILVSDDKGLSWHRRYP